MDYIYITLQGCSLFLASWIFRSSSSNLGHRNSCNSTETFFHPANMVHILGAPGSWPSNPMQILHSSAFHPSGSHSHQTMKLFQPSDHVKMYIYISLIGSISLENSKSVLWRILNSVLWRTLPLRPLYSYTPD